jgi:hypothetical protein
VILSLLLNFKTGAELLTLLFLQRSCIQRDSIALNGEAIQRAKPIHRNKVAS